MKDCIYKETCVQGEKRNKTCRGRRRRHTSSLSSYIYIYISKISKMYVKMVTRPVYKKLKEVPTTTRR